MSPGPYIECAVCHDRIRSKHRHDFRKCKCGETFVDGGSDYLRCGGRPVMVDGRIATFDNDGAGTDQE
jgi:hypothetical protein